MQLVSGQKNQFNTLHACHLPNFPLTLFIVPIGRGAFPETGATSQSPKQPIVFTIIFLGQSVKTARKMDYYLNRPSSSISQQIKQQSDQSSESTLHSALAHTCLHLCLCCTLSLSVPLSKQMPRSPLPCHCTGLTAPETPYMAYMHSLFTLITYITISQFLPSAFKMKSKLNL